MEPDWSEEYSTLRPAIYRQAWLILQNPDDAAEVLQSTFERAYRSRPRFDQNRPLRPWLLAIASHEAANLARRRKIRSWLPIPINQATLHPGPEDSIQSLALKQALSRLSAPKRAVVGLFYVYGFTVDEIATMLRVPRGTVASRLHASRKTLAAALGAPEPQLTTPSR
jgi:RNA polymerase sigma-70 factor (ECF subfamily)